MSYKRNKSIKDMMDDKDLDLFIKIIGRDKGHIERSKAKAVRYHGCVPTSNIIQFVLETNPSK